MEKRETSPSERLAVNPTENQLAVQDMIEGASYTVQPIENVDSSLPQPTKPKRRFGNKKMALALAGSMLISGATSALAQEENQPDQSPEPNSPTLTEPTSTDGETVPLSVTVGEDAEAQEDIASSESEDLEPISFYQSLKNSLNIQEALGEENEESDAPDFDKASGELIRWYSDNPESEKFFINILGSSPENYLNLVKKRAQKKNINKRDINIATTVVGGLMQSLGDSEDPDLLQKTSNYLQATVGEFKPKYKKSSANFIEERKDQLQQLTINSTEDKTDDPTTDAEDEIPEDISKVEDQAQIDSQETKQLAEIDPEELSIESILKEKQSKITKNQYKKIVNKVAPILTAEWIKDYADEVNFEDELNYTINDFMAMFNRLKNNPSYHASGKSSAQVVVAEVQQAQKASENGNYELAQAYLDLAEAHYRMSLTLLDVNGNTKKVLDKDIEKQATKKKVN